MSKPSKEDIEKYEYAHKVLFVSLVIANNLWLGMPAKIGKADMANHNSVKYKSWLKLGQTITNTLHSWLLRQQKLEMVPKDAVPKVPPAIYGYFFKADKMKQLSAYATSLIKPGTGGAGIGFIPLLIWGVVLIVAALSAAYIIDETTTTAQEKEELLKQTEKTLKDLNIPPDKAAEIIKDTQQQASENSGLVKSLTGGNSFLLPIGVGLAALFLLNGKSTSTKTV